VFAAANIALMFVMPGKETIPFHFVWISLALVYGLQPWSMRRTYIVLAASPYPCVCSTAARLNADAQPLTAPAVSPVEMRLWKITNSTTTGNDVNVAAAIRPLQSAPCTGLLWKMSR
jgi:hypothetical protein